MDIILRPRITEKSGMASESLNVYTFEVAGNASKPAIAKAIKTLYKVTPLKVRTISLSKVKKALIYLKKGDKIEFA